MQDAAFIVSHFVRGYTDIWDRYFPNCSRRGHWQIAQLVRMSEDGQLFSVVAGRTKEIFGMDEVICVSRTKELIADGLITSENEIRASTCLYPTPKLIENYDNHVLEGVQLLYETARPLDQTLSPRLGLLLPGSALNKQFFAFFAAYRDVHNEYRVRCLRGDFPGAEAIEITNELKEMHRSKPLQLKALRALMTYAYWYIFITAWTHQHPQGGATRPYLLVDDFHPAIFKHAGVGSTATSDYIRDFVSWGFLKRLNRADGVPKGKFAVRMHQPVFEFFCDAFIAAGKPIVDAASQLSRISAQQPPDAAVIGFPGGARENFSGTSPNVSPATAAQKVR
jgi:hypothetical protein